MGVFRNIRQSEPDLLLIAGTALTASTATFLIGLQLAGVRVSAINAVSVYLLLTLLAASRFGYRAGFAVAAASTVLLNFFFVEPIFGLHMSEKQHLASLPIFFIVAAVGAMFRREVSRTQPRPAMQTASSDVLDLGALRMNIANHLVFVDNREVHLTPTEFKLLTCLATNAGKVLQRQTLLESVWGKAYTDDVRILRTYINQLRAKLGDRSASPRFIRTEPGFGYRFLAPSESTTSPLE
ncbi:MAG: winged helix-turn-helix domain-containing protein [Chloroflexota bacterium]